MQIEGQYVWVHIGYKCGNCDVHIDEVISKLWINIIFLFVFHNITTSSSLWYCKIGFLCNWVSLFSWSLVTCYKWLSLLVGMIICMDVVYMLVPIYSFIFAWTGEWCAQGNISTWLMLICHIKYIDIVTDDVNISTRFMS